MNDSESTEEVTLNDEFIEEFKEEYGLDKLEAVQDEFDTVLQNNSDFSEAQRFASTSLASIRYAGFSILATEISKRSNNTISEDKILEGVEIINNNSEFIDSSREIHRETPEEFVALYVNNYTVSPDFERGAYKIFEGILWKDKNAEEYEQFRGYNPKVSAGTIIWMVGQITAWTTEQFDLDPTDINEIAQKMECEPDEIITCYREVFDKNDLIRVKDTVIDETGTLAEVNNLSEKLDVSETVKDTLFYSLFFDTNIPSEYDNKTRGAIYMDKYTDIDTEEIIEKSETTKSKFKRIKNKIKEDSTNE